MYLGCMYGGAAHLGCGAAMRTALPAFVAADGPCVASRMPAQAVAIPSAASSSRGVGVCTPLLVTASAAAEASTLNPQGSVCKNLEFSADAVSCIASLRSDVLLPASL